MQVAKNDVWDARLITGRDGPLLKVDVRKRTWTGGIVEHETKPGQTIRPGP